MTKRRWATPVLVVVVALMFAACQASTTSPSPASAPPAASEAPPAASEAPSSEAPSSEAPPAAGGALPEVPTGYTELDAALGADKPYNGRRVTIQTQWIGGEGANFDAALAPFEEATGIDVVQESIASQHEVVLRTRIEGGTPPDLAMLAQPSAVVEYGGRGQTTNVASFMDPAKLNSDFSAGFGTALLAGDNGEIWGVPYKVDVKSTIWYPIKAFEAAGYAVPTTWDELKALSAKIVADGNGSPWCLGILDGAATGWIATDWLEDVMLRTAGIDKYNQWITNDLKFDSPEVRAAWTSSPRSGSRKAMSTVATRPSRQPTASRAGIRCSRPTTIGTASPPAAGCTARRPGSGLTSSRMSARVRQSRSTCSAKTSGSSTSRRSMPLRAVLAWAPATRSWFCVMMPKIDPRSGPWPNSWRRRMG
jgi:ABC-type glycerol-3-phosphate transport system substrate-binding protein